MNIFRNIIFLLYFNFSGVELKLFYEFTLNKYIFK